MAQATYFNLSVSVSGRSKCDICGKMLSCKAALNRHIRVVHYRQKKFLCAFCDKAFGQNSDRLLHENAMHRDRYDYAAVKFHDVVISRTKD